MPESWTLDGVSLSSGNFTLMEINADPPRSRTDWISAADSESAALVRQPLNENRTFSFKIRVAAQASMNVALDQVGSLVDKIRKASATDSGISLVWSPANSTRTATFTVLAGEITGLPITLSGDGYSWLLQRPIINVELTAKPYWLGTALANITDAFASNSIADYTFDAGAAGNVSITGGVVDAVANLTTENRFVHTASTYALYNAQVSIKHTLGTTLASYKAGVILKRIDASNYVIAYVDDNGVNSRLRIDQVIAGVTTNLVSTNTTRMTISTSYWVRARIESNTVYAEHWTAAPTATGTAATSNTASLSGGGPAAVGQGISGRAGMVWIPQQTAAALDDLLIAPNVFSGSTPVVTGEIVGVPGDVPAIGLPLLVTDTAGQSRRHVEWGLEGPLTYNSATSLLLDSDSLVTTGFAGTGSTVASGAYDPNASGNSSITASLYDGLRTTVCGTGDQSHVGVFRVKARVFATLGTQVRLSWRAGDGPMGSNDWVTISQTVSWTEVDLGTITIPAVLSGTQRWTGQIDALLYGNSGTIYIDYLELIPASDGYGKARATFNNVGGAISAYDAFVGTTAAAALGTRAAPLGGSWATSGDATDFAFADTFNFTDTTESISRATNVAETTGRFAILGSTSYTDTAVFVLIWYYGTASGDNEQAVVARWVDSSNYLRLVVPISAGGVAGTPKLEQVVAGVVTTLASGQALPINTIYGLKLFAYASGGVLGVISDADGTVLQVLSASSSAAATGGALQTGKPGIRDRATGTGGPSSRTYTAFSVSTPAPEQIVVFSGRTIQIRHDDVFRDDSTGVYVGRPPSYRGSRFLVPVGTSRVLVKARRTDVESTVDDVVTDSTTIQVLWQPRGLAVPR